MLQLPSSFTLTRHIRWTIRKPDGPLARLAISSASTVSDMEPEAAWWEVYHDPVLTDLVRRAARENRDVKIAAERLRAARAGETMEPLLAVPECRRVRLRRRSQQRLQLGHEAGLSGYQDQQRGPGRLVGTRPERPPARRRSGLQGLIRWPRSTRCAAYACW